VVGRGSREGGSRGSCARRRPCTVLGGAVGVRVYAYDGQYCPLDLFGIVQFSTIQYITEQENVGLYFIHTCIFIYPSS
jgi:hypothetical protein